MFTAAPARLWLEEVLASGHWHDQLGIRTNHRWDNCLHKIRFGWRSFSSGPAQSNKQKVQPNKLAILGWKGLAKWGNFCQVHYTQLIVSLKRNYLCCINWGQILANSMSPEEYYPSTFKWNKSWLFSFNANSCYLFFWIFTVKNTSFRQIDNTDDYWSSHSFHAEEACYVGPYWWEGRLWSGNAQKVTTFRS